MNDSKVKKFMYINRRAPCGTIYSVEGLEVALIGAAFEQDVCMAFIDDGVFQLKKNQDTSALEIKSYAPTYRALGDYDVNKLYVEKESLQARGLDENDLMELTYEDEDDDWVEKSSIKIVGQSELAELIAEQDVVLSF